jgi:hypothetical protein
MKDDQVIDNQEQMIDYLNQQISDLKHERDLAVSSLSMERDEAILAYEQMSDAFSEIMRNADRMKAVSRYAAFAMSGLLADGTFMAVVSDECKGHTTSESGDRRLDRKMVASISFDFGEAMYDEQVARTGVQATNCRRKEPDLAHNEKVQESP